MKNRVYISYFIAIFITCNSGYSYESEALNDTEPHYECEALNDIGIVEDPQNDTFFLEKRIRELEEERDIYEGLAIHEHMRNYHSHHANHR